MNNVWLVIINKVVACQNNKVEPASFNNVDRLATMNNVELTSMNIQR